MRQKLEQYLEIYGGLEQFNLNASQDEKDDFFLIKKTLEIEYDQHFLGRERAIDRIFSDLLGHEIISIGRAYCFARNDPHFSPYSRWKFRSKTNVHYPKEFFHDLFPEEATFLSIFHFMVFQKAVLFLNRETAVKILNSQNDDEWMKLCKSIRNIEEIVWKNARINLMEEALVQITNTNQRFKSALLETSGKVLFYEDIDTYWGVNSLNKLFEVRNIASLIPGNYLGKLLTKLKQDLTI